jgi:hypothetical protein
MTTSTVLITGNTYPVKDAIRALGGRWDASAKGWRVPAEQASKAQALVASAPASSSRSGRSNYSRGSRYSRYQSRLDRAGDANTCNCKYCQSGSECLCIYG